MKVEFDFADLREELVGKERGTTKAFKIACGEAIHHWRQRYAHLHFAKAAYSRYAGIAYEPKYATVKHWTKIGGRSRPLAKLYHERTGKEVFSVKEAMQWAHGAKLDDSPLVLTGATKEGITKGAFRVSGTSSMLKGHFNDFRINWYALGVRHGGRTLAEGLVYTNFQELGIMGRRIQDTFFPHFLAMSKAKIKLPHLSALPIVPSNT